METLGTGGAPEQPLNTAIQLSGSLCQFVVLRAFPTGVGTLGVGLGLAGLGLLLRGDALWTGLEAVGAWQGQLFRALGCRVVAVC